MARNNADVQDSWDSVMGIIEFYGGDEGNFSTVAGPGFWNDPDMVNFRTLQCVLGKGTWNWILHSEVKKGKSLSGSWVKSMKWCQLAK